MARLGSRSPKRLAMVIIAGPMVSATNTVDDHANGQRDAQRLEVGQPGERKAERRTGDRHARAKHHMGGAAKHRVVGRFPVLADRPGFLIAPDEEDRIVGRSGDPQRDQKIGREGRKPDQIVIAEERHHASGRRQPEEHHEERQEHRDNRPIHQEQHQNDHAERGELDGADAFVAGDLLIGRQRRASGHEDLDAVRR